MTHTITHSDRPKSTDSQPSIPLPGNLADSPVGAALTRPMPPHNANPTLRALSLGAGVQSTTLLLLAAQLAREGIKVLDVAVFADTGWEPAGVYAHLDRLERTIEDAKIPIRRVSAGHIRDDALNRFARFAQMPLYVLGEDDSHGMLQRKCTAEYKVSAIKSCLRRELGYPGKARIPADVFVRQWIGISSDETSRAVRMETDVRYMQFQFPLIFLPGGSIPGRLGWTRQDCQRYLRANGFGTTPRSACVGCPFHSNAYWREMRDHRPLEWADAVEFDRLIRHGYPRSIAQGQPLHGQAFLHRSRVPLDQVPIDRVSRVELASRQGDIFSELADAAVERGCSPWACRGEDDES